MLCYQQNSSKKPSYKHGIKKSQSWQRQQLFFLKKPIQVYFPEGTLWSGSQSFSWIRAISVHLYHVSYCEEQQLLSIDLGRRVRAEMPSCYRSENVLEEVPLDSCVLWKYKVWQLHWILSNTTVVSLLGYSSKVSRTLDIVSSLKLLQTGSSSPASNLLKIKVRHLPWPTMVTSRILFNTFISYQTISSLSSKTSS